VSIEEKEGDMGLSKGGWGLKAGRGRGGGGGRTRARGGGEGETGRVDGGGEGMTEGVNRERARECVVGRGRLGYWGFMRGWARNNGRRRVGRHGSGGVERVGGKTKGGGGGGK